MRISEGIEKSDMDQESIDSLSRLLENSLLALRIERRLAERGIEQDEAIDVLVPIWCTCDQLAERLVHLHVDSPSKLNAKLIARWWLDGDLSTD